MRHSENPTVQPPNPRLPESIQAEINALRNKAEKISSPYLQSLALQKIADTYRNVGTMLSDRQTIGTMGILDSPVAYLLAAEYYYAESYERLRKVRHLPILVRAVTIGSPELETKIIRLKASTLLRDLGITQQGLMASGVRGGRDPRAMYTAALDLAKQAHSLQAEVDALRPLAVLALSEKNYGSAHAIFQQLLEMARQDGSPDAIALVLTDLADLAGKEKDQAAALRYITEALSLAMRIVDPDVKSNLMLQGAQVLEEAGRYEDALGCLAPLVRGEMGVGSTLQQAVAAALERGIRSKMQKRDRL